MGPWRTPALICQDSCLQKAETLDFDSTQAGCDDPKTWWLVDCDLWSISNLRNNIHYINITKSCPTILEKERPVSENPQCWVIF